MGGACSTDGVERGKYRVLVGAPEGKRSLGRPRHRWMIIGWIFRKWNVGGMDWVGLAQDRDR
jgi:hypothetical protein